MRGGSGKPDDRRGGVAPSVIWLILTLLFAGLAPLAGCGRARSPVPAAAPAAASGASAGVVGGVAALGRSEPVELSIPGIEVRSRLVGLGLNPDGSVQVPSLDTPMLAGWYAGGPTPGELGPAVVLGHVDAHGRPGVFFRLRELRRGDEVEVRQADGQTAVFTVTGVEQVRKSEFPTEAVYGDTDRPELRLITCGGQFDHSQRSYQDNIIVYAALTAVR